MNQRDLLVGEGTNLLTVDRDYANQHIVFEHWHFDQRTHSAELGCHRGSGVSQGVSDREDLLCRHSTVERRFRPRLKQCALSLEFGIGGWRVVHRECAQGVIFDEIKRAEPGLADAYRVVEDELKDEFQFAGRA